MSPAPTAGRHDGLRLAELLADRLCREAADLTSPLAGDRLRLLRAAWAGTVGPLERAGLARLCAGLPHGVHADFTGLDANRPFAATSARLLLNLALLAAGQLDAGGVVAFAQFGPRDLAVIQTGPGASWPPGFAAWMADPELAWRALDSTSRVQGPLTALLAQRAGARLSFALAADAEAAPPLMVQLA